MMRSQPAPPPPRTVGRAPGVQVSPHRYLRLTPYGSDGTVSPAWAPQAEHGRQFTTRARSGATDLHHSAWQGALAWVYSRGCLGLDAQWQCQRE